MKKTAVNLNAGRQKLIISAVSILLISVLVVLAAYGWFGITEGSDKDILLGIGKVEYTVDTSKNIFYSAYELDDEFYDDDYDEDDEYIPAISMTILGGGTEIIPDNEIYRYSIMQNKKSMISAVLAPMGATDKVTFSSSNVSIATVNAYGSVTAIGDVGQSANITITVTDRRDASVRMTAQVTVTVILNTDTQNEEYGYLPGNVNILRDTFKITNKSTVSTKTRVKVDWQYGDFLDDENGGQSIYTIYDINEILPSNVIEDNTNITVSTVRSPLTMENNVQWKALPAKNRLCLTDTNGIPWSIEALSLTESDHANLTQAIANGTAFVINERMINKASASVCYSTDVISSINTDYGTAIPKRSISAGDSYSVINQLVTNENYASFSAGKRFTVGITVQSRQAKAYDAVTENSWFNVYCTKEDAVPSGTQHGNTSSR